MLSYTLDWEATDDFEPEETDVTADFEKNEFLDLRRPLFWQVWEANFSKAYYMQQVHQPRHTPESPRLFAQWYLEVSAQHWDTNGVRTQTYCRRCSLARRGTLCP